MRCSCHGAVLAGGLILAFFGAYFLRANQPLRVTSLLDLIDKRPPATEVRKTWHVSTTAPPATLAPGGSQAPPQDLKAGKAVKVKAPPRSKRIAVAFHGQYIRQGSAFTALGCSNFFEHTDHINATIFQPLRRLDNQISTFFHTYSYPECTGADEELVAALEPVRHIFDKKMLPRVVDSYIKVLHLVKLDQERIDYVVLARFDVRYHFPISSMNIDWEKINFPWHAEYHLWISPDHTVSDLLFVLPISYIDAMIEALRESQRSAAHWVYNPLARRVGSDKLQAIENITFGSGKPFDENDTSPVLGIDRRCGLAGGSAKAREAARPHYYEFIKQVLSKANVAKFKASHPLASGLHAGLICLQPNSSTLPSSP